MGRRSVLVVPAGKRSKKIGISEHKKRSKQLLNRLKAWLLIVKFRASYFLIFSSVALIMLFGLHHYLNCHVYAVLIDDREIGYVTDAEEIETFVNDLTDSCSELYRMHVEPGIKLDMIKVYNPEVEPNSDTVRDKIRQQITFLTDAHLITINDAPLVPVISEEDLDQVIEHLKTSYINDNNDVEYLDAFVVENFDLQACTVSPKDIFTAEEVSHMLVDNNEEQSLNTASLSQAPEEKALCSQQVYSDIMLASIPPEGVSEQQECDYENNIAENPRVHVKTIEEVTVTESIPFPVEKVYDDDLWIVQNEVTSPGQEGKKEVVYHVIRKNGVEVERKKVSEKIIKAPVTQVENHGTSQLPSRGTGHFIWPVEGGGKITPGRGFSQWHTGIDIDSYRGNNVLAAESGVVWFSGYGSVQGNYIIIYHGRYWTLYLHNSVNHVSRGDEVARGDVIAEIGSTGRSTGPHLHFEVRRDDGSGEWHTYYQHDPIDPLQFFRR